MAEISALWRLLPQDMPVTLVAASKKAAFCSAPQGTLALRVEGTLPEGKLILVATSQSKTVHWCQDVQSKDNCLFVSMAGFEAAIQNSSDAFWSLELGRMTKHGITCWSLSQGNLSAYYKKREGYFLDDRVHFGPPVFACEKDGLVYEAVPNCANNKGLLRLEIAPREDRYLRQVTCRLTHLTLEEGVLQVTIQLPAGGPRPLGLSLHPMKPAQPCGLFFPLTGDTFDQDQTLRGQVPLTALETLTGPWTLSCVLAKEPDALLHIHPRILDADLATGILEQFGPHPAATLGREQVYLSLTEDHCLRLERCKDIPGCQEGPYPTLADFLDHNPTPSTRYASEHVGGEDWHWRLRLPGWDLSQAEEVQLVLHRERSHRNYPCSVVVEAASPAGSVVTADISPLIETLESCLRDCFYPLLAVRRGSNFWYAPLYDPRRTFYGARYPRSYFNQLEDHYAPPVGVTPYAGHPVEASPYWKRDGRTSIMLADQCLRYYYALSCRSERAALRFGVLHLQVRCPKLGKGRRWVGMMLTYRYKLEEDRREYFIPLSGFSEGKSYDTLSIQTHLKQFQFNSVYWDLRPVFEEDGKRFWLSIKAPMKAPKSLKRKLLENVYSLFFPHSMSMGPDHQLFLYRTGGNRFALVYQEKSPYSGFLFRLKERLACLIYVLNKKKLHRQNIMLTYEKYCCMAQDNGFYFFQYCMEHNVEKKLKHQIYFIIDPKSADYENVKPYEDHIIPFMSLKHMVYLLACRLMVSSDSKPHAYAWRCKESIIQPLIEKNKRLVFLQHGVISLKKVDFFKASGNTVSLFVTSNQREHDIIVRELGYRPDQVIITGLTRWDVLRDRSAEVQGSHILVMPTWRNWLEDASDHAFRSSDYYRNYMELLNSPRLAAFLEQYDTYLDFYIHPKFRDYLSNFSVPGGRVRLIPFGSEPLNRLIMECKMLVTDYSSVCWDVYYQGKPCIFYQFDVDKYNEAQGAYIDLETELFGDRALNNDQLFALLEEEAAMGFQLKPKYAEMRKTSYAYLDHNNSQRVCQEIKKRNW